MADICTFEGSDAKDAARDAILFQTSDVKLRKKLFTEDYGLDDTVKLGLAHEQSEANAAIIGSKEDKTKVVRRLVEEVTIYNNNEIF